VNTYETTFILEPGLDEAKANEEIDKVSQWIQQSGGEVVDVQRWGKRRLAYEINKKRDGVYTHVLHKSPGELVKELERRMRLNEAVMRVLTVIHVPQPVVPVENAESRVSDNGDDD
jgi:small subunit ribosomal protein S6